MSIRLFILLSFFIHIPLLTGAFAATLWEDLSTSPQGRLLTLDEQALLHNLERATTNEATSAKNSTANTSYIELPLPSGETVKLYPTEYSIMEGGVRAYGDFRSWKVRGVDNPAISGVVDISSNGLHALLLMHDGETVFIRPTHRPVQPGQTSNQNQKAHTHTYTSSKKSALQRQLPFQCGAHSGEHSALKQSPFIASRAVAKTVAQNLKTYRLAMAATGEFTQYFGGRTAAMNEISSIVNQLNAVYERDLGIRLQLVANNASIVFTNPNTDPYINSDEQLINNNTSIINAAIGSSAYDIGHVLTRFTNAVAGIAELASICNNNSKGAGVTGSVEPDAAAFAIDFVAHEIGHQLGANHTFNSTTGSCSGGNRVQATAFEPGSGSSIMAYAGICGVNNIANQSLTVFHIGSITEVNNTVRVVGDCALDTTTANQNPEISSSSNITVNAGQQFTLTGAATDPDGDTLSYTWDQIDAGTASDKLVDTGNNALFEMTAPMSSPSRVFPGRAVTNRELTFDFVVRDDKGGISTKTTTVTVINATGSSSGSGSSSSSGGSSSGSGSSSGGSSSGSDTGSSSSSGNIDWVLMLLLTGILLLRAKLRVKKGKD